MRYHILTTDYDGTIAENEHVSGTTLDALVKLKATGRYLILVTGRELDQLQAIFPEYTLFDLIVAENGALIYNPSTLKKILLGERPPDSFIQALKDKGIPLSVGEVIVATWEPHQDFVLETIKVAGLEHQVIFNKGAIMILPPGVNKATGLHRALKELNLSEHNTVAVGDAENDNAMLQAAECAVAVSNALPQLKANADWTTTGQRGEGVSELISQIIQDDLANLDQKLLRHYLEIGKKADGSSFEISPYGNNILLAGTSGCFKQVPDQKSGIAFHIIPGVYAEISQVSQRSTRMLPPGTPLHWLKHKDQYQIFRFEYGASPGASFSAMEQYIHEPSGFREYRQ